VNCQTTETGLLLSESGMCARPHTVARFRCDHTHRVTHAEGHLEQLLGYQPGELWAHEWAKVLRRKEDLDAVLAISRDLNVGKLGAYSLTNVGKSGERFYLVTRTFLIHSHDGVSMGGVTTLDAWESPRTRVFMGTRES
jgi:hypothetical protein